MKLLRLAFPTHCLREVMATPIRVFIHPSSFTFILHLSPIEPTGLRERVASPFLFVRAALAT